MSTNTINTAYDTPESDLVSPGTNTHCEVNFFTVSTRIGRVRYLSHLMLFYALAIPGLLLVYINLVIGMVALAIAYIAILILTVIAGIQRLHDLDKTGWLWLLFFVPLINVLFAIYILCASGSDAPNNYGTPPPPNKRWNIALALVFPLLFILGIVASIALPMFANFI